MKYILIGFAVWFALAWLPQFIKTWVLKIRYRLAKKRTSIGDKWIYEI